MRRLTCGLTVWLLACGGDEVGSGSTTDSEATGETGVSVVSTSQPTTDGASSSSSSPASTTGGGATGNVGTESGGEATSEGTSSGGTTGEMVCAGELPAHWIDGVDCAGEPEIQVHAYDENTWILRQSLCTSFEGPFMYLLFGTERALLLDTGDGGIMIAQTVTGLVDAWAMAHGRPQIELVVANSHAHGDHTAGNGQFVGLANTTIVGVGVDAVTEFFGISNWPEQIVTYDLGGRVLDVVPLPGHEKAHIALFDRATGLAITGDTLYPGRLYVADFPAYVASVGRLVDHLAGEQVCRVLGAHVEMTNTPGEDFDYMQPSHPDEHPLELTMEHLLELRAAVEAMDQPAIEVHDDFIVYPL